MAIFSKRSTRKLNLHLQKLKTSERLQKPISTYSISQNTARSKLFIKNKKIAKALLIEVIFIKLELENYKNKLSSFLKQFALKNKGFFVNNKVYDTGYSQIAEKYLYILNFLEEKVLDKFHFLIKEIVDYPSTVIPRPIRQTYKKRHVYFARFFMLVVIHFIPFIQLTSTLLYTQPNRFIVHPLFGYLISFFPFLLDLMKATMSTFSNDNFSFLLLGFYFQIFIFRFKRYKIPRKVAFQGAFAILLMLLNYCVILSKEILTVSSKFLKRFSFLNAQKFDLLRDEIGFYIEDLGELREYRERYFQLGEKIFSLDNITKAYNVYEVLTLIPFLCVIALFYNCMYFILRGKKPIIPVVTKTVKRMMIDRNGTES